MWPFETLGDHVYLCVGLDALEAVAVAIHVPSLRGHVGLGACVEHFQGYLECKWPVECGQV